MSALANQEKLWKDFKQGNRQAFELIYRKHYPSLYQYALKVTASKSLAQEYVQDLFVTLWKRRKGLADVTNIKAYLFKSLNRLIARSSRSFYSGFQTIKSDSSFTFSPEELLIELEHDLYKREILTNVLNSLPSRQRQVIYLKYYEDMSYAEIADTLQINYQSVINLIYKGFKKLRDKATLKKLVVDSNTFPLLILSVEFL